MTDGELREGEMREKWIIARDAAVLALLYGSGLRISEALGLKRKDYAANADALIVLGKGNKTRMVPLLAAGRQIDRRLHRRFARRNFRPTARCSSARAAAACRPASYSWPWRDCAAHSDFPTAQHPMRCAILSRPIYWRAAATCAPSRSSSGTHRFQPRRSTRPSIPSACWKSMRARTRAPKSYASCPRPPFRSSLRERSGDQGA